MLVASVQQGESAIYIYIYIHTHMYIYVYTHTHICMYTHTHTHSSLDPFPIQVITECWVECSVLYNRSWFVIYFIYSNVNKPVPVSQFIPFLSPPSICVCFQHPRFWTNHIRHPSNRLDCERASSLDTIIALRTAVLELNSCHYYSIKPPIPDDLSHD